MKYLLSTLNSTKERARSIKDYIELSFLLDPRDLRYNKELPTISKEISTFSPEDQDTIIEERIHKLIDELQSKFSTKIRFVSLVKDTPSTRIVTLDVEEELIKVIL